jgi:probable phosphoglycerate mutase
MALIMLIRHGRTPGNSSGRFIGQHDEVLDEEGRRQAVLLVPRVTRFNPSRVVSSDLKRCTQTMAPFAKASGMTVETDPALREVGDGEWTNRTLEELWAGWPDLMERYRNGEDVPRPGGERWSDVRQRVLGSLSGIIAEVSPEDRVVICTHAGPSMLISSWVTGSNLPGNIFLGPLHPPANASVTIFDPHHPALISYNETCHLSSAAPVPGAPR